MTKEEAIETLHEVMRSLDNYKDRLASLASNISDLDTDIQNKLYEFQEEAEDLESDISDAIDDVEYALGGLEVTAEATE